MKLLPSFAPDKSGMVCHLRKSFYRLNQAPRCWFAKLLIALKGCEFLQSYSNYSLFTYVMGSIRINVRNDSIVLKSFKGYLNYYFNMKDIGALKYFLRIEVARLLGAKPVRSPIEKNHKFEHATWRILSYPKSYRQLMGPNLAYSIHVEVLGRGSTCCPVLESVTPLTCLCHRIRKTKKQHIVSCSSTKAKYKPMASVTCELKSLKVFLLYLCVLYPKAILLFCDSEYALHIPQNPIFHERTKHI
ncbi:retrovirus-related Pol polyprotein from transposon TNT 1-94 isoform X3 [Gossypium australe]|uniref:Retrovirus-related Pol polyprotein from transposon TNT 1-94 isoform X3 n=1 Tax=Gossypium australe TaxID=47621 RepID=A0A5B6VDZ5_9ROSI|nr:retrovirus-related Pol polyprotein from transposon TNT 1-94 isoform X3 [Gossypium australe]